ncbi:unnamed protein product, partial [marine sediment metagenome]
MTFDPFEDFSNIFSSFFIFFIIVAVIILVIAIIIVIMIIRGMLGGGKRSAKRKQQLSPFKEYPDSVYKNKETTQICQYCGEKMKYNKKINKLIVQGADLRITQITTCELWYGAYRL